MIERIFIYSTVYSGYKTFNKSIDNASIYLNSTPQFPPFLR